MTEVAGDFAGLKVVEARKQVLEALKEQDLITEQKDIVHRVQVFERSKKEIEYIVLPQWFISVLKHKEDFLYTGDEVEWHPGFMKSRYQDWVKNLSWDWCISRQRFFGIPFQFGIVRIVARFF